MAIKEASEDAVFFSVNWTFSCFWLQKPCDPFKRCSQQVQRETERERRWKNMKAIDTDQYDWGRCHEFECMENDVINGTVLDKKDDLEHTCSLSSRKQSAIKQVNTPTMEQSHGPTDAHLNKCISPCLFNCWLLLWQQKIVLIV